MLNDSRTYRKIGDKITLTASLENVQTGEWEISDIIGEGSSAVCYSAVHLGKTGRLKEYSPINTDRKNFEDFIKAYRILDDTKCHNPNFEIINNYIPHYEIMYECDEAGNAVSVFIWTPDDKKGTTFESYVNDISADIAVNPDKKLYDILRVTSTLADCICLIHTAGLLHLDIKPSNFLVTYNSRKEINAENISLFDINTLYSIESDFSNIVGTMGYCAPEVSLGCPDNRADIYSIGAMLFSVIMKSGPKEYHKYEDSMYDDLLDIIKTSRLITGAGLADNGDFMNMLCHILKKCLAADRNRRYDYCEQLQKDIEELTMIISRSAYENKTVTAQEKMPHRRKKLLRYLLALIIMAGAVFMFIRYRNGNKTDTEMQAENVETNLKTVEACSPDKAYDNMIELIKAANKSFKQAEKYVYISSETVGNTAILFKDIFEIFAGVTVEFADDMRFVFPGSYQGEYCAIIISGTMKYSDTLLDNLNYYQTFGMPINDGGIIVSDGITFTVENPRKADVWECCGLIYEIRQGRFQKYFEIDTRLRVSESYEAFNAAGFNYYFGHLEADRKEIFFEGSDEAFDWVMTGYYEKIMTELSEGMENDIYVDYPLIIGPKQELWINPNKTVHIIEGGSITVEKGGNIVYASDETGKALISEEGGILIVK